MMKKIIFLYMVLVPFILSGCAASVMKLSGLATSGPKFSSLSEEEIQINSGQSQIVVYRMPGKKVFGVQNQAGIQPYIYVNDNLATGCKTEGVFIVDVEPGTHEVLADNTESAQLMNKLFAATAILGAVSGGTKLVEGDYKEAQETMDIAHSLNDTVAFARVHYIWESSQV